MIKKTALKLLFLAVSAQGMANTQTALYQQFAGGVGIDVLLNVGFAVACGLIDAVHRGKNPRVRIDNVGRVMMGRFWLSAAAGMLMFALTESFDVENWRQFMLVGLAGWGGRAVPDAFLARLLAKIMQRVEPPPDDGNNV